MTKDKDIKESDKTGYNYIALFSQNVILLNHWFGLYDNLRAETELKKEMDDKEKAQYIQTAQTCRYYVTQTMIQYRTITKKLRISTDVQIQDLYNNVKQKVIMDNNQAMEEYVQAINDVLMDHVIQDILQNSEEFLNKVFQKNE